MRQVQAVSHPDSPASFQMQAVSRQAKSIFAGGELASRSRFVEAAEVFILRRDVTDPLLLIVKMRCRAAVDQKTMEFHSALAALRLPMVVYSANNNVPITHNLVIIQDRVHVSLHESRSVASSFITSQVLGSRVLVIHSRGVSDM